MRARVNNRLTALPTRRLRFDTLEPRTVLAAGIGVFAAATDTFTLRNSADAGAADAGVFDFNLLGSTPVTGDWNGDHKDDFGIFDPATATWSLKYGAEAGPANAGVFKFGETDSIPVVGDWNGDGRDDIGTFKAGTWQLRFGASPGNSDAGVFQFGAGSDQPIVGDWDGDGKDGIGLFNATDASWTLREIASASSSSATAFTFGPTGGTAVVGDWNGDGQDGIGVFQTSTAQWTLRQTASPGVADAGTFNFGTAGTLPITGDWNGPAAPADALATVVLPPVNLDLLGLQVRTSPITVTISANPGDGDLLGNLLSTVSTLVDLDGASRALNTVLDSTVDLLNTASLSITGAVAGPLDTAEATAQQVLELFVAPVHLDLLGVTVDTSTIRVTITTQSGEGLVLGNALNELTNLFNPPLPEELDIDFLNMKLDELLAKLDQQLPGIAPAPVEPVQISEGQILNVTVPPLDLDLLGLVLETSPITVNASAEIGNGLLLGNVLTTALKTLDATPENLSELNTTINGILAKVVGVLNVADLSVAAGVIDALPPALQTLLNPVLTAPAAGATTPVLDLMIASTDGTSPPVNVDLLGLVVTTSNIEAHLTARTGEGQILGNLLYNVANLADPGGPAGLLNLLNLLGAGSLDDPGDTTGGSVTPPTTPAEELLTLTVNPLNVNLLGLEVRTDPIIVTLSTQGGDGKLLGNLLNGITTLINVDSVGNALNNVLSTTVDLLNSSSLIVNGVGSGTFDTGEVAVTPVLDLFVAPVHLDLLGLLADTQPIHVTITANSGNGRVLGNVITELANLFNPPLPEELDIDVVNGLLEDLIDRLNAQIPGIIPAPIPPVQLDEGEFLELTVPTLDVNLLGLVLQTSPITVNAAAETGNGLLLGNVLTTVLDTLEATPENLTGLNENLNMILAKVVGVLNAAELVLPTGALDGLLSVLTTLTSPTLVTPEIGASTQILDLTINSGTDAGPPVDVDLLGLQVSTSNIDAQLIATTGEGQVLGNLLYNVANLLNPGGSATLLSILTQLGDLPAPDAPRIKLDGVVSYTEGTSAVVLAPTAIISDRNSANFGTGTLTVGIATNADGNDRLGLRSQGTAAGQIGVSGTQVTYGGVVIGSFSGGTGATPLVITLNGNATLPATQALVRNITFRTLGTDPVTASRTVTFSLTDDLGGLSNVATMTANVVAVSIAPTISNFGGAIKYTEDRPAIAISAAASVADKDSANFAGGTLTAKFSAGGLAEDRLAIRTAGTVTTNASRQVLVSGVVVGTYTGGIGTAPLVVTFNTQAIAARVRDVLKNIVYSNVSQNPSPAARTVWTQLTDGDGGTSAAATKTLTVVPVNDAPILSGISGAVDYILNSTTPVILAAAATVSDIDSPNFNGGRLTVQVTSGKDAGNRLKIGGSLFTMSGSNVMRNGVVIGRLNSGGGVGTTKLELTFNDKALPSYVGELISAISFSTQGSSSKAKRVMSFSVTDGDGGTSATLTKTVNVK